MKVQLVEQAPKVEVAVVVKNVLIFLSIILISFSIIKSETLPEDDVQINLNTYFDNFGVTIIYPEISAKKSIGTSTVINGRYLADAISSASMRSRFDSVYSKTNLTNNIKNTKGELDAYSSASKRIYGGKETTPDELRHEFGIGILQYIGDISISLNNLYSTEHDYTSETIAASLNIPMAQKNSNLTLGLTKSWDKIFPETRSWTETKNALTLNIGFSQILSKDDIAQLDFSYNKSDGFLSDAYQIVKVLDTTDNINELHLLEPYSPNLRERFALGIREIHRLSESSSLQIDYRYYKDSWEVNSHTIGATYNTIWDDDKQQISMGLRYYTQNAAYFFSPDFYLTNNFINSTSQYISVDSKLNKLNSNELQLKYSVNGSKVGFINNKNVDLNFRLNFYARTTETPDWHSGKNTLYAYIISIGFKYLY